MATSLRVTEAYGDASDLASSHSEERRSRTACVMPCP